MRDIVHRKRVEEALRESEQRLSEIFGFLPDATFAIDQQGKSSLGTGPWRNSPARKLRR